MDSQVIYWLLAILAVGVIVVTIVGVKLASKGSGKTPPRTWTPPTVGAVPPAAPPSVNSGAAPGYVAPPVTPPVKPPATPPAPRQEQKAPVAVGPQPVTIYQFPIETITCVCPRCDGENNPAHKFCWICGQRIS